MADMPRLPRQMPSEADDSTSFSCPSSSNVSNETPPDLTSSTGATGATSAQTPVDDFGPQLNFAIWIMTALALAILSIRIYCKVSRRRGVWWDDYVLIVSWLSLAVASAMTSVSVSYGYGRFIADIAQDDLEMLPLVSNVAGFFSILAALWSKTSFALTLTRITDEWVLRFVWLIIISTNLIMGASAIMIWFTFPIEIRIVYFIFSTAYSGAMDVILSLIPWKILWNLTMTKNEKFGVLTAMSMGVIAGVVSFIKISQLPSLRSMEPADSVQLVIFGVAESAATIVAASIPILRALLRERDKAIINHLVVEYEMNSLAPLNPTAPPLGRRR